ncbi:hypothetical protein, variant 3 [Puccinia striiformis f. sp. tritici PST-78]|uniref:C3H1-type domain-containing protein n=1 Tax=Puccinia striiformis f. sp. tritici PST-78 TaxID=1165861 RepID=A0A0L0V0S2_9BASI|nr:hypothetical protein PSTG_13843 [Puccinia striiformis f. sp. tritici PST-78]KNE92787.1 hypothetical protein, variant 1 [Puccinia striiformis f. sp. tritici PST-78]KNE92788.1 hypothetical protein, variant 2 [Puccinia striiformis f. sp. tritici PST-78]KNE92789.1 hypothetical protein, variant 3 [Puccinia striiformis f. sp. tritici PST-78]
MNTLNLLNSVLLNQSSSPISSSSSSSTAPSLDQSMITKTVLSILANSDEDEDEKPERLKSYLTHSTQLSMLPETELNQIILSLLHQHREDQQQQPKLTRSSSQRITIGKHRFHTRSPHPSSSTPSTPPFSARQSAIPPALNVQPPADKLNATAIEFKPILSRTLSMPFQSKPTTIITQPGSDRLAPQHSPLFLDSTPRSASSAYFIHRPATPEIPRDPWLKDELDEPSPRIQSRLSHLHLQQTQEIEYNHHHHQQSNLSIFSPFENSVISPLKSPLPFIDTETVELNRTEPSCPTALEWGMSPEMTTEMAQFTVWDHSDSDGSNSQPPAIIHHPPTRSEDDDDDDELNRYWMTPFEELSNALRGSGISDIAIDQALHLNGFDTSKSMDYLLNNPHQNPASLSVSDSNNNRDSSPIRRPISPALSSTVSGAVASSRPNSPRFVHTKSPTFIKRNLKSSDSPSPSIIDTSSATDNSPSHRVCRFYLQGCCLRSDCKFSHDVGKAICRFWLKGHCLKGESKCDFLHEIPDLVSPEDPKIIEPPVEIKVKSFTEEFPSLTESKNLLTTQTTNKLPNSKKLREVKLLPNLKDMKSDSPSLQKLSETYQAKTLELRQIVEEGSERHRKMKEEIRMIGGTIISERNRLMKDAVRAGVVDRASKVDQGPDRMHRGKEMGGGICLGVVSNTITKASLKERMEVLMDLHGLLPDDGVYYLEKFMMALKTEGYQGLAYVLTSSDDDHDDHDDRSVEKDDSHLEKSVVNWLDRKRFLWQSFSASNSNVHSLSESGIFCIDPIRKA